MCSTIVHNVFATSREIAIVPVKEMTVTLTYKVTNAPHISIFLDQLKYSVYKSISIETVVEASINLPCPTVSQNLKIFNLESFRWISTNDKKVFRITGIVVDNYYFPEGRYFTGDIDSISLTGELRVESS